MTLSAQVSRFMKPHLLLMRFFPKFACPVVTIARRLVKRSLGLAKGRVCSRDEFPVKRLKPRSFHVAV
jgi:hypothetical protein